MLSNHNSVFDWFTFRQDFFYPVSQNSLVCAYTQDYAFTPFHKM